MDTPGPGQLGGTFGGNPVSCAASLAALKVMDEANVNERAVRIGHIFRGYAEGWQQRFPLVGDVRGMGAMQAIELVRDRVTKTPAKEETQKVLEYCHQHGLLILSAGVYGNVVRLLVPLVATDEQMEEGLAILEAALEHVSAHMNG